MLLKLLSWGKVNGVLVEKELTLSENLGLGIPAPTDRKSGVTLIGDPNSVCCEAHKRSSSLRSASVVSIIAVTNHVMLSVYNARIMCVFRLWLGKY